MQRGKKIAALFLALAMLCTMLPETAYAAMVTDEFAETFENTESTESAESVERSEDSESTEDLESTEGFESFIPETESQVMTGNEAETEIAFDGTDEMQLESGIEMDAEEQIMPLSLEDAGEEDIDAVGVAIDEYTFLSVGDPLKRTGAESNETFAFQPDVSGWYHVKVDSNTEMGIYATRVYTVDGEENKRGPYPWTPSCGEGVDHVFYGQADDIYLFDIRPYNGAADYTVSVDGAEIRRIEVTQGPDTVYDSLNYDGMQLKLVYSDGTYTTTDVDSYGRIEAFYRTWMGINYFNSSIQVEYYGDEQDPVYSISDLEGGTHTVHAYIRKYENGNSTKVEFTFDIIVERDAVESLEVLSTEKTTYEAGFNYPLNSTVIIRVNYKDGREAKEISSNTAYSELYQYFKIKGTKFEVVDEYLENGGSLGEAAVYVSYRGVETTYPITIVENPYSGIDVTLNETQFYTDCGFQFGNSTYPGEYADPGRVIAQVTLHLKDTSKDDVSYSYDLLPEFERLITAGLKLIIDGQTVLYQSVDDYLLAGGTIGEAVYVVNYAGMTTEVLVEICTNPYSRIEIITPPSRTNYIEGKSYSIVTEGMVIRAYDAEDKSNYTDITIPGTSDTMEDRRILEHLFTRLGGNEDTRYLKIGTHDVTVFYYGHSATYTINVVDSLISDFSITEEPEYTEFLVGNTGWNRIDLSGMKVSFTLNGEKYENLQIYSSEYDQLCEQYLYSEWIEFDSSKVNFKTAGIYPVKVSFMGATAEYQVKVLDKIVDSIDIISAPNKTIYYERETEDVNLDGLEIAVIGLDEQVTKYKAYVYSEADGYGSWNSIAFGRYSCRLDTSSVNFDEQGTYEAVFYYGGVSEKFTIEIIENPVASIEIKQMPQKMSYYQFEGEWSIDLEGLQFIIHYKDGTPDYSGTVSYSTSSIEVNYKNNTYYITSRWRNWDFYSDEALAGNAIVLSFLGVTKEIPASLLEDPISEIEVVKNPTRMAYPSFFDRMVDLYGAEFKIFYKDGTTETVSVQEHVSNVIMEKSGLSLNADLISWSNRISISAAGMETNISLEKFDFSNEIFADITENKIQSVTVTAQDWFKIYRFVPTETKEYTFFSEGTCNSYGYIYEEDGSLLASNFYGGTDWNFSMTATLTEGKAYYCVARMLYVQTTGSFICCISSIKNSFSINEADVEKFEIIKAPKTKYYTYESDVWLVDVPMNGLEYRITCKDGTVLESRVNEEGNCAYAYGVYINGRFKYVTDDRLDMTRENAIIYSIGDLEVEVPITFNEASLVESIVIENNPWSQVMQYNAFEALYDRTGLELTVHYTDGTKYTVQNGEEWIDDGYYAYMLFDWKNRDEDGMVSVGENAIVITYMGISVEAPVLVRENMVRQIAVIGNPEKMTYLPFENEVDLYGLNLEIVDQDGNADTVKIMEHCSGREIESGYGTGTVNAYISYDENGRKCIKIDYMNCSAYYYPSIQSSYAELLGNATELEIGKAVSVSLNSNTTYQIYKFTPTETMRYAFSSAGNADTYVYLIDENGEVLDIDDDGNHDGYNFKLSRQLESGTTYYYLVRLFSVGNEGSFSCILENGEPEMELTEADITLDAPAAGEAFSYASGKEGYSVYVSWMNAENENTAEYAKAYRAKIVLTPDSGYAFTTTANVRLNGKKAVSKTYNSNGTITVYYTFPYTDCRITVSEVKGYALDESANSIKGQTEYGGSYSFRYQKKDDSVEAIVVSADGKLLKADEDGFYTITGIKSNISVSARVISQETKEEWTRLNFYNKETLSDSFYAARNDTVAASGEDNVLPILESYANGSDQFFFGWYQSRDNSLNGIGARFRSTDTVPDQDILPLYAKWGIGIFSCIYNTKTVNYKILSIDEDNRLKVQVADCSNVAAAYAMDADAVDAVGNDDVFTIPSSITDFTGTGLDELGIEFNGCEVTAIAENAFRGNADIRKISLPDTITEIGSGAFSGCTNLESIQIPGSVSKLESGTFSGCENLVDVILAEGVTSIGGNVFEGCSSLKTIIVPDSVEDIDATAFSNSADNLTIICSSNLTDVVSEAAEAVGAAIQTVDIVFDYAYADKEFTYGDKAFTVTAKLLVDGKENEKRTAALSWQTADGTTDYYAITQTANTAKVTPKNVTDGETYDIIVTDGESAQTKSIALSTTAASLARVATVNDIAAAAYTGSEIRPKVDVKLVQNGTQLVENTDYTVAYSNNTNIGAQAMVKITGINNYCGEITKYFTIQNTIAAASKVNAEKIELNETNLRIKLNESKKLTAKITPSGANKTVTWTSSNPFVATVSSDGTVKAVANGTAKITVAADGKTAVCQVVVPYTITYKLNGGKNNSSNPSDYYNEKVTLQSPTRAKYIFAGWYTDKKFKNKITKIKAGAKGNYVLYAKWTKISLGKSNVSSAKKSSSQKTTVKLKASSKNSKTCKIEVKYKKIKKADGYEIAYSTNKKYKKSATNSVLSKKRSVTLKLQKEKTYYIRIRAYRIDSTGEKVYGKWTSSKTVNISK